MPPEAAESHTHLAHAVIRYLGLTAPEELVPFGINSAAGIVDLISRVSLHLDYAPGLFVTRTVLPSLRLTLSHSLRRHWRHWVSASLR